MGQFIRDQFGEVAARGILTAEWAEKFQAMIMEHFEAFDSKKLVNKLSKLPPMKVALNKDAKLFVAPPISLGPSKKKGLRLTSMEVKNFTCHSKMFPMEFTN